MDQYLHVEIFLTFHNIELKRGQLWFATSAKPVPSKQKAFHLFRDVSLSDTGSCFILFLLTSSVPCPSC